MVSNKIKWYKQLCAEVAYEKRLLDYARKNCHGNITLPKDKGGKGPSRAKYLRLLDEYKIQAERERKKKQ